MGKKNKLKIMLVLLFLISLKFIYSVSETDVLIVADNDVSPWYEGITSELYYQAIINNITNNNNITYNITIWNQTISGSPSLSYLQSFALVIWDTGDFYDYVPSIIDIATLENYVKQGGKLIISGTRILYSYLQNSFTDNVLHANGPSTIFKDLNDINITNITHPVTSGFTQNESFTFIASPGGYDYWPDVIENVVNGGQVLAVRGKNSLYTNYPTLVVFENTSTSAKVLYIAFPIFLLAENNRTNLIRNAMKWMDNYPPTVHSINLNPSDADNIDSNVRINITVNVTDLHNVSAVVFEYKCAEAGRCSPGTESWVNDSMQYNSTTKLWENASFTPTSTGIWSYRVWANDTLGNSNYTGIYNLSVEYDYTWTITTIPSATSCIIENICSIGNITINNTGDYNLTFDLSSNWVDTTTFNETEPFTLENKTIKNIIINLTTQTTTAQTSYSVAITIDATTASAAPDLNTLNLTFVVYAGGPYFQVSIIDYTLTLTQGGTVSLTSKVKNIGNDTSLDTWLNWTLPAGWSNSSGNLSFNIGNLSSGETIWNNITALLSSSASAGTSSLIVNSSCNYKNTTCANTGSASVSVVVSCSNTDGVCGAGCTTSTDSNCVAAAAGGGGGGAAGGKAREQVYTGVELTAAAEEFEITRGYQNSFPIIVNNPYKFAKMHNVTLSVTGYMSQYLSILPDKYDLIDINSSELFNITIISPAYMQQGEYTLKFNITSKLIGTVISTANEKAFWKKDLIEQRLVKLVIYEVRKEDANDLLITSENYIAELEEANLPAIKVSGILEKAKSAFLEKNYKLSKELSEQIKLIRDDAFKANELINEIKLSIAEAEKKALKIAETKRLFNLALAAFEREDFKTAIQRLKDAQLSYVIETKGKINIVQFILDYYWLLIPSLIGLIILGYIIRNRLLLLMIKAKITDLEKETLTINGLMKEIQEKAFKEKKMSLVEYHKQMYNYEKRLSEIRQLIARLRAKRIGIIKLSEEIDLLKNEDKKIVEEIKKNQDMYYNKKNITKRNYAGRMEEYKLRRAEIEKSAAILEAKLEKKKRLEELKEMSSKQKKKTKKEKEKDKTKPNKKNKIKKEEEREIEKEKREKKGKEIKFNLKDLFKKFQFKKRERKKKEMSETQRVSEHAQMSKKQGFFEHTQKSLIFDESKISDKSKAKEEEKKTEKKRIRKKKNEKEIKVPFIIPFYEKIKKIITPQIKKTRASKITSLAKEAKEIPVLKSNLDEVREAVRQIQNLPESSKENAKRFDNIDSNLILQELKLSEDEKEEAKKIFTNLPTSPISEPKKEFKEKEVNVNLEDFRKRLSEEVNRINEKRMKDITNLEQYGFRVRK